MIRNKQRNPRIALLKMKISTSFILLMCLTLVIVKCSLSSGEKQESLHRKSNADELLDSLVKATYPEGTIVTYKGNDEYIDESKDGAKETEMGAGFYRRVSVKTKTGQEYTFFQKCDTGYTYSTAHWIIRIDDQLKAVNEKAKRELTNQQTNK